ncbi:MAG: HD domain-containing protein [Proteobacteria bacterium]|nr:HD domain-containing protein [Pseudomonadota bacterium]
MTILIVAEISATLTKNQHPDYTVVLGAGLMERKRMIDLKLPATFLCLARAEASKDFGTSSHERRVAALVYRLARQLGLPAGKARQLARAGILHDIGKLAVPVEVLQKTAPLSREEVALIKTHSSAGHHILRMPRNALVNLAAEIALHHHERFDGSGYPNGLVADAIPLPAQITSICDTYDALREDRPYRRGIPHDDTMRIIVNGDNRTKPCHFAPQVLSAFQVISDQAKMIFDTPIEQYAIGGA